MANQGRFTLRAEPYGIRTVFLSSSVQPMSTWRKLALAAAPGWTILVLLVYGGPLSLMNKMMDWPIAYAIVLQVVNNVFGAVIIAELLRVLIPSGASWSDTRHFQIVGVVWVVMTFLSVGGFMLMEHALHAF